MIEFEKKRALVIPGEVTRDTHLRPGILIRMSAIVNRLLATITPASFFLSTPPPPGGVVSELNSLATSAVPPPLKESLGQVRPLGTRLRGLKAMLSGSKGPAVEENRSPEEFKLGHNSPIFDECQTQ